jgi:hypothetical protein
MIEFSSLKLLVSLGFLRLLDFFENHKLTTDHEEDQGDHGDQPSQLDQEGHGSFTSRHSSSERTPPKPTEHHLKSANSVRNALCVTGVVQEASLCW